MHEQVPIAASPERAREAIRRLVAPDRQEPAVPAGGARRHTLSAALFGDRPRQYRLAVWLTDHGQGPLGLRVIGVDDEQGCSLAAAGEVTLAPRPGGHTSVDVLADLQLRGPYTTSRRSIAEEATRLLADLARSVDEAAADHHDSEASALTPAPGRAAIGGRSAIPAPPPLDWRGVVLAILLAAAGAWVLRRRLRRQR